MKIEFNNDNGILTDHMLWGNQHCVSLVVETEFDKPLTEALLKDGSLLICFHDDDNNHDSVTLIPENNLEKEIIRRKNFVRRSTNQTWIVFISQPMLGV